MDLLRFAWRPACILACALTASLTASTEQPPTPSEPPGRGISEDLARERSVAIHDLQYELAFDVPADRREPVQGRVIARFRLDAPHRIVFDFAQPRNHVRSLMVGGRTLDAIFEDGHLVVPSGATSAGRNEIAIDFTAGDGALNRDDEFLYTLFVPARAQLTFPCFDQPDLKARFTLTLTVPSGWQVVANAATVPSAAPESPANPAPLSATFVFAETAPLPTYLFSFVAGRFSVETATRAGRAFRMFHRETDAAKVARNREAIFDLHAAALAWLEDYTSHPLSLRQVRLRGNPVVSVRGDGARRGHSVQRRRPAS